MQYAEKPSTNLRMVKAIAIAICLCIMALCTFMVFTGFASLVPRTYAASATAAHASQDVKAKLIDAGAVKGAR